MNAIIYFLPNLTIAFDDLVYRLGLVGFSPLYRQNILSVSMTP